MLSLPCGAVMIAAFAIVMPARRAAAQRAAKARYHIDYFIILMIFDADDFSLTLISMFIMLMLLIMPLCALLFMLLIFFAMPFHFDYFDYLLILMMLFRRFY